MGHPSKLPPSESVAAAAGWFPGSLLRTDRLSGPAPGVSSALGGSEAQIYWGKLTLFGCGNAKNNVMIRAMEHRDLMIRIYCDLCGDMTI